MCWCQTVFYDWLAAIPATLEDHIFRYRGRAEGGQPEALFIGALCFDYWTDPNSSKGAVGTGDLCDPT